VLLVLHRFNASVPDKTPSQDRVSISASSETPVEISLGQAQL